MLESVGENYLDRESGTPIWTLGVYKNMQKQ